MTWPIDISDVTSRLDLRNERVSDSDAVRQLRTVTAILHRLANQPGIVLADEVGMGKTFVALGVAMMAALADRGRRPVVIMVPSSLHEKWPRDFKAFRDLAIVRPQDKTIRIAKAQSGLEFFRLLDNDTRTRPHIIFLKHGAFHVQNIDHWVRLALIKRAMQGMPLGKKRDALPKFAAQLLKTKSSYRDPELFARLLGTPNNQWRATVNDYYADRPKYQLSDDPVPDAIQRVIESPDIDVSSLRDCLRDMPERETASIERRLESTRLAFHEALQTMWPSTLASFCLEKDKST